MTAVYWYQISSPLCSDHNSCLFLSQALWPPQTYRAYLSIGGCSPQAHICALPTLYNDLSHKHSAGVYLGALPKQHIDIGGYTRAQTAVHIHKHTSDYVFTHTPSRAHTRLSKQASGCSHWSYSCTCWAADCMSYRKCHCLCSQRAVMVTGKKYFNRMFSTGRLSQGYFSQVPQYAHTHIQKEMSCITASLWFCSCILIADKYMHWQLWSIGMCESLELSGSTLQPSLSYVSVCQSGIVKELCHFSCAVSRVFLWFHVFSRNIPCLFQWLSVLPKWLFLRGRHQRGLKHILFLLH